MRKIHRVIYQEIIPPGLIALMVLTFVVFTREFGRLTELLIRQNADTVTVLKVVLYILPSILVFTLPMSFLVGTLVGFSRLSTESEVVAMRAGGIGLRQILRPVLRAGLLVAVATLVLTVHFWSEGNWKLRLLRHEIGMRPMQSQLKPRVFNEDLPGKLLYVEDVDLRSGLWKGVFLADQLPEGKKRVILAGRGELLPAADGNRLQLALSEGSSYLFDPGNASDYGVSQFGTLAVSIDLPAARVWDRPKRPGDKTMGELWTDLTTAAPEVRTESNAEFQRRLALPLSALIFAVLGVTLGITPHRGGRGYGAITSLVVAFSYYLLFATGSKLASQGAIPVWIGAWSGNLVLGGAAVIVTRHARRGTSFAGILFNNRISALLFRRLQKAHAWVRDRAGRLARMMGGWLGSFSDVRLRMARVIDSYVLRLFSSNLFLTLLICAAMFYLFTFFELLDDLFASQSSSGLLFEYFFFLAPHVVMLLVPISVLIATLVTFGLLEKTRQTVALKACGVSIYRIAVPVLALTLLVCSFLFVLQDYVLPYSNQKQDSLRHLIKGRPAQTYYQPGRNWIFGKNNRLYNYNYFDTERRLFGELSIYEITPGNGQLLRHTHARRALWDADKGNWELRDGWRRELGLEKGGFARYQSLELSLPEAPDYFAQEVTESSKMTYLQLDRYVSELQQGGFEVDHLKTELYEKISFPLVSFVMVLLGIPFAFSIGRKGALHGVALGVFLGIVYWGAFGVFGVLGGSGLLSPLLAAWGPNLLFGSCSVVLFLNLRT